MPVRDEQEASTLITKNGQQRNSPRKCLYSIHNMNRTNTLRCRVVAKLDPIHDKNNIDERATRLVRPLVKQAGAGKLHGAHIKHCW